jgi:hypothetical protein
MEHQSPCVPNAHEDTILLPFQEQNRSFEPTMPSLMKSLRKVSALTMLACLALTGCSPKESPKTTEPLASERPALKIWLVDAPELDKEISVRWQASSDQALKIDNFSSDRVGSEEPFNADVVIYPSMLLGDLVQKQLIGRLPPQALGKGSGESGQTANWPVRWRTCATFGNQLYAVPLGITNLAPVISSLEPKPLNELNGFLAQSKDINLQSMECWSQFFSQAETAMAATKSEREQLLADQLGKWTTEEKRALVDRFLFLASTTTARSRGLFELVKMESRLNQVEFGNSARLLARMARLFPDTIAIEPEKAWAMAMEKMDGGFALGWPSSIAGAGPDASGKSTVAQLAWNPGRGLLASIGKKTRQTAVSSQFLAWISEPEQRESLRSVCTRVELTAEQNDRNNVRDDYRAFQAVNNRDLRVEPMGLSLRMANANQYRAILADCLVDAIREPEQIDDIMAGCSRKWNQLTAKLGIESQRLSEEQSLGFSK